MLQIQRKPGQQVSSTQGTHLCHLEFVHMSSFLSRPCSLSTLARSTAVQLSVPSPRTRPSEACLGSVVASLEAHWRRCLVSHSAGSCSSAVSYPGRVGRVVKRVYGTRERYQQLPHSSLLCECHARPWPHERRKTSFCPRGGVVENCFETPVSKSFCLVLQRSPVIGSQNDVLQAT